MSLPTPENPIAAPTSPALAAELATGGTRVTTDRLSSTLFVAALAHGVLILGVTFTSNPIEESTALPSLNVTLVVDTNDLERPPDDADWLAQANQSGGGSADEGLRPTTTLAADQPLTRLADPEAADLIDGERREAAPPVEQLVSRNSSEVSVAALPKATEAPSAQAQTAATLLDRDAPETLVTEIDERAELPASDDDGPIASPATRESELAGYLDGWRKRVERIGTLNFPATLKDRPNVGRPTLEVAIGADGSLTEIIVRSSSGDKALDQAALTILRLAAPFEPLPDAIREHYEVLRFAYEWDFTSGAGDSGRIAASEAAGGAE